MLSLSLCSFLDSFFFLYLNLFLSIYVLPQGFLPFILCALLRVSVSGSYLADLRNPPPFLPHFPLLSLLTLDLSYVFSLSAIPTSLSPA